MASYFCGNTPMPTTAIYAPQPTTAALRTMLQIAAGPSDPLVVWKWGLDFDGSGTVPIRCELMSSSVATTGLTAHVASGVMPLGPIQSASAVVLGAAATGYATGTGAQTAPTEANARYASMNSVLPNSGDRNEWSLGREFFVPAGHFLKIRLLAPATVNCACYVNWDE